jgi:hypothetical protein
MAIFGLMLYTTLMGPYTEHARLKDHVAGMEGGLEAKIHEGGKHCILTIFHCFFGLHP